MSRGILFDGLTADQHDAEVSAEAGELVIEVGSERESVAADELAIVDEDKRSLTLSRKGWSG